MLKRRLPIIAVFAACFLATIGLLIYTYWVRTGYGPAVNKAHQEYVAWKANGLPTTREQLFDKPLADKDNAAFALKQAFDLFKPHRSAASAQGFWDAENYENGKIATFITGIEPALHATYEASTKPDCRFPRDLDLGIMVLYPEFAQMKTLAKFLAADAEIKARKGERTGALLDIRTGRRLAYFAARDPGVIGAMVGIAIDSIMLDAVGTIASDAADQPTFLAALRKSIEDTNWKIDPARVVRSEAYSNLATLRNLDEKQMVSLLKDDYEGALMPIGNGPLARDGLPRSILARSAAAEAMAFWNAYYPRLADDRNNRRSIGAEMDAETSTWSTSSSEPKKALAYMAGAFGGTDYQAAFTAIDREAIHQETMVAFLAILQYHQAHGSWPPDLKTVRVDALDLDGKPLRYRHDEKTARVWSIGANLADDGGVSPREVRRQKLDPRANVDDACIYPWPKRPPPIKENF
jgi:hypothetical protein